MCTEHDCCEPDLLGVGPYETVTGPGYVIVSWCRNCPGPVRVLSTLSLRDLGNQQALSVLNSRGESFLMETSGFRLTPSTIG